MVGLQPRSSTGFAFEAACELGHAARLGRDELDGHPLIERLVPRRHDDAHPSARALALDAVLAQNEIADFGVG